MVKPVETLSDGDKLALAGVFGQITISSGTISSPVEYFDVALPAGYGQFKMNIRGIQYDAHNNTMGIAVSSDGGTTFICDTDNGDSYYEQGVTSAGVTLTALNNTNSLMDIDQSSQSIGANPPHVLLLDIFPGSGTETFHLLYATIARNTGSGVCYECGSQGLNPTADVTPTPARVNMLRILPYGNGDCQPPTGGDSIVAGSWSLVGII